MKDNKAFGVVVLGKYSLMKEGISRLLQAYDFRILALISGIDQFKSRVRSQRLLFLLVYTGDDFGSIVSEIELLRDQYPDAHVAVVAEHYGPAEPALAFEAGAIGYLVNAISCDAFIKSVELLMLGELIFPPTFRSPAPVLKRPARTKTASLATCEDEKAPAGALENGAAPPQLSPRETTILRCLIEGASNKFIARKIDIAEATVKAHVKAILRKIRVQNRTQAAIWGMNNELLLQPANNNLLFSSDDAESSSAI